MKDESMSLESEIKALREAVEANTAALLGGAAPATQKSETAAQKKKREEAEAKAKTEAAAKQMAEEDAAKAAEAAKAKPKPSAKADTLEAVTEAYGKYLAGAGDDEDELNLRRANVKAVIEHFGIGRLGELESENFAEAMTHLASFEKGEKASFMSDDSGDSESLI